MAGEATIEATDDTIVTVEIDGDVADLATPQGNGIAAGTGEGTPAPKPAAPPAAAPAVDEAAAVLQRSLDDQKRRTNAAIATADAERRRADAEAARADQAGREAMEAREAAQSSQLTTIVSGIEAAQQEFVSAKAAFKTAHEAGDADGMADAQARIGTAAAQKDRLTADKQAFETAATRRAAEPPPRADVAEPALSVEATRENYITRNGFAPAAQSWLRSHPECLPAAAGGDDEKNAAMMEGHWAAKRKGIPFNTPQYFEVLETHIGGASAGVGDSAPPAPAPKPPAQRQAMPSAPPSREPPTPDGRPTGKQSVQLTPQMQEIAQISYPQKPGEDDTAWKRRAYGTYANQLVQAKAEGKIGRLTH